MQRVKRMLLMMALLVSFAPVSGAHAYANSDQFWKAFRQAILHHDAQAVANLTKFPFEVRGEVDSDPVRYFNRKNFPLMLKKLIYQQEIQPSNGKFVEKSMFQLIEEKPKLAPGDFLTPSIIRIYDFKFEVINGHWLFVLGYLGE